MCWERARRPEQKAVRREAILTAARDLFAEMDYEAISLNGIAREAEISKPNVYRYFATREEIFLTIFEEERDRFVRELIDRVSRVRSKDPVPQICRLWVDISLRHLTMLDLLPELMTSLEKNSSVEQIVAFKKTGFALLHELVETLAQIYPKLSIEQWGTVVECSVALMAGLWPLTNPGRNVREALAHPEVQEQPWEFEPLMTYGLQALIQGHPGEKKGQKG